LSSFIATVVAELELQGLICFPDVPLQCVKPTELTLLAYGSGLTKGSTPNNVRMQREQD